MNTSRAIILIPTYNEVENIQLMLDAVMALPQKLHVLVVDDSSPDGTAERVKSHTRFGEDVHLLVRKEKEGLAQAYFAGFDWALEREYAFVFEMDADFSHNPKDLPRLLSALEAGSDVVVGSRYAQGVNVVNWPMSRVLLSYGASLYVRWILGLPIADSTAGFVGYTAEVLRKIDYRAIRQRGYGFQVEMKYRAWLKKFKIEEVSIIFTDRVRGESKISNGIIYEAIWGIIHLKWKKWTGKL